ncbi:MAG: LPS-assembly lipoprotein [Candidatus Azotimanducaceae bacterium]|jgi:LPS-assembly lipoprotein
MRPMLVVFLFSLTLALSSCGFQLRGTGGYELAAESVSIVANNNHSDFADELEDTLKSIGVVVNPIESPEYVIRLNSETTTRRPVASSGTITVSEYEVRLRAVFSISTAAGEILVPDTALVAERIYSFDSSNFVGNSEEESVLVDEMRQDLAGQLVRRFSATLRTKQAGETITDP